MSMNILNDISKIYLEQVAVEESKEAKPDYLDFDGDGNKKESMKKALKDKKNVEEAVKGQDPDLRRAASAERQAERKERGGAAPKIPGKQGPSAGKTYADYQQLSIAAHDKATRGKTIHGLAKEALDPVGQEDADIDNDGKANTKSDKYLLNRRKVRGKAIATHKEGFSNWRQDLSEVMDTVDSPDDVDQKEIKEKKIENKVKINPDFKEAVEEMGGVLLETVEVDEAFVDPEQGEAPSGRSPLENVSYHPKASVRKKAVKGFKKQMGKEYGGTWKSRSSDPVSEATFVYGGEKKEPEDKRMTVTAADKKANTPAYQKFKAGDKKYKAAPHLDEDVELDEEKKELPQSKMYRKAGNLGREIVSSRKGPKRDAAMKRMNKIVSTINRETERKRFDEIGKSPAHNEEFELDEKTLTAAETKKKEEIVKSMKKSAGDFEKRYPGRGKEVMYATATKQAKKLAEAGTPPDQQSQVQQTQDLAKRTQTQQKQRLLQILQQKERAVRSGLMDISASYEPEGEIVNEGPEDRAQDERLMRGGIGAGRGSSKPSQPSKPQTAAEREAAMKKHQEISRKAIAMVKAQHGASNFMR